MPGVFFPVYSCVGYEISRALACWLCIEEFFGTKTTSPASGTQVNDAFGIGDWMDAEAIWNALRARYPSGDYNGHSRVLVRLSAHEFFSNGSCSHTSIAWTGSSSASVIAAVLNFRFTDATSAPSCFKLLRSG